MLKDFLKYSLIGFLIGYLILSFAMWWSMLIVRDLNNVREEEVKKKEDLRAPIYQALNPFYYWVNPGWYIFYLTPSP